MTYSSTHPSLSDSDQVIVKTGALRKDNPDLATMALLAIVVKDAFPDDELNVFKQQPRY